MSLSLHAMAVESFAPMLRSLSAILGKAAEQAGARAPDLASARLAPDMYTLAQQVQLACRHAGDGVARLAGTVPPRADGDETTLGALRERIAATVGYLESVDADAFEGAEERDCSVPIPGDKVIAMTGVQFLRAWALPHFYFHVVTAYDILRHHGIAVGKQDYLSQVGAFVRPRA